MRFDVIKEYSGGEYVGWVEADTIEQAWDKAQAIAREQEWPYSIDVIEAECPDEYDDEDELT